MKETLIYYIIKFTNCKAVQTIGDVSSTTIGAFNREASDKELSLQFLPMDVQNIIGKSPIVLAFAIAFVLNIIVPEDNSVEED